MKKWLILAFMFNFASSQIGFGLDFMSKHKMTNIIYFFIFAIIWVALLGFGSPLLIISGILFGQLVGTLISVISFSVGALILYSIGNYFFRDLVKKILEHKFNKYILCNSICLFNRYRSR